MSKVQQIYCTHCTYGSAALEQRQGDHASRILGYSARASSLTADQLRKYYRNVERFLSYSLPSDAPAEEKLRLNAATAPRRLFYYPSANGQQVLGQISYRQKDTAQRPGSYFAHLLMSDADDPPPPWPVLRCLQLWAAPWVDEEPAGRNDEEPAGRNFELDPLDDLDDLRGGNRPAIDDEVLLSFLRTPPGGQFHDPAGVIPDRWRDLAAEVRAGWLTKILASYLASACLPRRESVLVVAEPSVAALLFYGVARLLPDGPLRRELSFSTFESDPNRLTAALVAMVFHDPATDLKPDVYRVRKFVHHTFLAKASDDRPASADHARPAAEPPSAVPTPVNAASADYALPMVERLCRDGWDAVDPLLERLEEAEPSGIAGKEGAGVNPAERSEQAKRKAYPNLKELIRVDGLASGLLQPNGEVDLGTLSAESRKYLAQGVRRQLAGKDPQELLQPILHCGKHLQVLNLIAGHAGTPEIAAAVDFLVEHLGELTPRLLTSDCPAVLKARALAGYLVSAGRFPPACEKLWEEKIPPGKSPADRVVSAALARLCEVDLRWFTRPARPGLLPVLKGAEAFCEPFLLALVQSCHVKPDKTGRVGQIIQGLNEPQLCGLLAARQAELEPYPADEPALGERLQRLLDELHGAPDFDARLNLLWAWRKRFPSRETEARLACWKDLRAKFAELRKFEESQEVASWFGFPRSQEKDYSDVARQLAEAMNQCMPMPPYGSVRYQGGQEALQFDAFKRIGSQLMGRSDFLPQGALNAINEFFNDVPWPKNKRFVRAGKTRKKTFPLPWSKPMKWLAATAAMLLLAVILVPLYRSFFAGSTTVAENDGAPPSSATEDSSVAPEPAKSPTKSPPPGPKSESENPKPPSPPATKPPPPPPPPPPTTDPTTPPGGSQGPQPPGGATTPGELATPTTPGPKPGSENPSPASPPPNQVATSSPLKNALSNYGDTTAKQPAAKPTSATKVATEFIPLPPPTDNTATSSTPDFRVERLTSLDANMHVDSLAMHGTKLTESLSARSGLRGSSPALSVYWKTNDELARFWVDAVYSQLKFKWFKALNDVREEDDLRLCVLEIKFNEGPSKYVALCKRKALVIRDARPLPTMKYWPVTIRSEGIAAIENSERFLGLGTVILDNDKQFPFDGTKAKGGETQKTQLVEMPDLVRELELGTVSVSVKRKEEVGNVWNLMIEMKSRAGSVGDVGEKKKTIANLHKYMNLFDDCRRKHLNFEKAVDAVQWLADYENKGLDEDKKKHLPPKPKDPDPIREDGWPKNPRDWAQRNLNEQQKWHAEWQARWNKYLDQLMAEFYIPAARHLNELEKEVNNLKAAGTENRKNVADALKRVKRVSAELYREVDDIRVPDVVVGEEDLMTEQHL